MQTPSPLKPQGEGSVLAHEKEIRPGCTTVGGTALEVQFASLGWWIWGSKGLEVYGWRGTNTECRWEAAAALRRSAQLRDSFPRLVTICPLEGAVSLSALVLAHSSLAAASVTSQAAGWLPPGTTLLTAVTAGICSLNPSLLASGWKLNSAPHWP